MSMIQASALSKKWKTGKEVIHSFSYRFEEGQSYQLVGANGRGKTTLLKMMCGLIVPSSGQVTRSGDVSWCSAKGCGATPRLTGLENINVMAVFLGLSLKEAHHRLDNWRACHGFDDALKTDFGHCSQGMQMMISLYLSQMKEVDVLIWDEPFAHLAPDNVEIILRNWQSLTTARTLIFTAHEELKNFQGEVIGL